MFNKGSETVSYRQKSFGTHVKNEYIPDFKKLLIIILGGVVPFGSF
jgi:hypothetical protein